MKRIYYTCLFLLWAGMAEAQTPGAGNILYVDINATGNGNGDSWTNAVPQLADALKWARQQNDFTTADPLKIYVAKGTYKPLYNAADNYYTTTGSATSGFTDRDNAFVIVNNVQLYGGFDPATGIDDLTDTRDYTSTILSGDIGTAEDNTDNTYHVLIASGEAGSALLDGFTVTGAYSSSNSPSVKVNGLDIAGGSGGGMFNRNSSPAITNCSFTGNTAYIVGGAIFNGASSPAITNCSFTGNRVTASNSEGGGAICNNASAIITNCSFTGNTAATNGGAMSNSGASSLPTIINCSFKGNTATSGGAMYNGTLANPTVTGCSFTENTASTTGGAMYSYYAFASVTGCSFTENSAPTDGGAISNGHSPLEITDCIFTKNTAYNRGGAMDNSGSEYPPTIINCSFIENTAHNGGGAMYNYYISPTITDCRFTGNTAANYEDGGALYNEFNASPTITNCNFTENKAGIGGGMYNQQSSPNIQNSIFTGNTAAITGGAMYNFNWSAPNITNCSFTGNRAYSGGAISNSATMATSPSSPIITDCSFTGNTADYAGGIANEYSGLIIRNSIFTGNSGGAMHSRFSSKPTIINTTIADNGDFLISGGTTNVVIQNSIIWDDIVTSGGSYTATHSLLKGLNPSGTGNINATTGLTAASVFNNYSGGDYTLASTSPALDAGSNALFPGLDANSLDFSGNPRVYNSIIDLGAYEFQGTTITPGINNILYVNINIAGGNGSGNSWANAIPELADALKYARIQYDADHTVYDATPLKIYVAGGTYKPLYNAADGLYTTTGAATAGYTDNDNAFVMVKNVQIYGGFDPANGIDDLTDTRILPSSGAGGSVLSGNVGTAADKAYHVIISSGDAGSAVLDGFTVTGAFSTSFTTGYINVNSAVITRNFGGGMHNLSSSPAVTNCSFTANTAYYAGGMYNSSSSPAITKCSFSENTATADGGGMYNFDASSPAITNCSFTGNTADRGSGIFINSSSPTITNTTFAHNGDNGLYIAGSTSNPVFQNSVIWETITTSSSGNYTASHSIIKGENPPGTGNINATSLTADEVFADYTGGDYTLKFLSPAKDAGSNALFPGLDAGTLDLAGNPRAYNSVIDLGAYEFQGLKPDADNIMYVNINVSGGNGSGNSWTNAIPELADALKYARIQYDADHTVYDATPLKIYVAGGAYKPLYNAADGLYTTTGAATAGYTDNDNAFVMVKNVQVYGGFDPANGIDDLTDMRILPSSGAGGSVLSGNVGTAADKAYHVIISSGDVGSAVLDGFTVTGAFSTSFTIGYINVNSAVITRNFGGGMHNLSSSPAVTNCSFTGNTTYYAGGMHNSSSSPAITNCSFTGNTADRGSGTFTNSSSPTITNTTFAHNGDNGLYIAGSTSNPVFQNSVIWDVVTVSSGSYTATYSLLKDLNPPGTGNIDATTGLTASSVFKNYSEGEYTLASTSPAANAGSNLLHWNAIGDGGPLPPPGEAGWGLDLAGNPRVSNSVIDLGAYEFQGVTITPDAANILYVNINILGGDGSGSSWANAIPELADVLQYARIQYDADHTVYDAAPLKIYVARGTYKPLYNAADELYTTTGAATAGHTNNDNAFVMVKNVQVYGGFDPANGIDDLTDTRILPSSGGGSVLSGNMGTATDKAYHVVISSGNVGNAVLDGFTVTGAYSRPYHEGSVNVNGTEIIRSQGGGMYNHYSSPVVTNCNFNGNSVGGPAGGMYNFGSSPAITNCSFTGNTATGEGGGIFNTDSSPAITNSIFTGNTATYSGGGIHNLSSSPTITNTTIANNGNNGFSVAGFSGSVSNPVLQNSIIWDVVKVITWESYTATHSLMKDLNPPGTGNINAISLTADDVFADYTGGNYTLKSGSPAINTGSNDLFPGLDNARDLAGSPRLTGADIDMGAYEYDDALPVRWISFEGRLNDQNQAVLTWKTDESDVSHYEAERSRDGRDFHIVGSVAAGGRTGSGSYALVDPIPVNGIAYYRVRQVDFDGTSGYSGIISVRAGNSIALKVYPNPAREEITVELDPLEAGSQVRLVSMAGAVLQKIDVKEPIFSIRLNGYPAGIYLLHIADGKVVRVTKE